MDVTSAATADSDMYMTLLMAQLRNQDPTEPMSNTEMTQLAQLSTVDALNDLSTNFADLLSLQQLTGGAELIGREVEYASTNGSAHGTVESLLVSDTSVKAVVDGVTVGLSEITRVL